MSTAEPAADCALCPRLAAFREEVRTLHPDYFCAPVPSFGEAQPRLLIVGLAPGMHGANRTGRPFTGDYAGILLYRTLHEFGWSSAEQSIALDDGLTLSRARITNAVRCLPPENKPLPAEVRSCNAFLAAELRLLAANSAVLALGAIAHGAVLRARGLKASAHRFAHGAEHALGDSLRLFDSYHCSRYNTQTKRLDETMFRQVFVAIAAFLAKS
jgi:uracil-DNA glycosylase family 4